MLHKGPISTNFHTSNQTKWGMNEIWVHLKSEVGEIVRWWYLVLPLNTFDDVSIMLKTAFTYSIWSLSNVPKGGETMYRKINLAIKLVIMLTSQICSS